MKFHLLLVTTLRAPQLLLACLLALPVSAQAAGGMMMLASSVSTVLPALSVIEGANTAISTITSGAVPCEQGCKTPGLADLEPHMTCTAQDSYLQNEIQSAGAQGGLVSKFLQTPLTNNGDIKPFCILNSMQTFEDVRGKNGAPVPTSNYQQCTSGNGSTKRAVKPCLSDEYDRLVVNSYQLVAKCMAGFVGADENGMQPKSEADVTSERKQDMESIFGLINQESGFHVSAKSPTGSGGTGQISGDAIRDVNKIMGDVRSYLSSASADPDCAQLSSEFLKTPMDAQNGRCERTSIKAGNPVKNLIYTFAYLHINRRSIEKNFFGAHSRWAGKFDQLSDNDKEKIIRALTVWAHNAGADGIETPTSVLLDHVYKNAKVTNADAFISQLQQYVDLFPAQANRRKGRPKESSQYYPLIKSKLADINQAAEKAGVGSCQN